MMASNDNSSSIITRLFPLLGLWPNRWICDYLIRRKKKHTKMSIYEWFITEWPVLQKLIQLQQTYWAWHKQCRIHVDIWSCCDFKSALFAKPKIEFCTKFDCKWFYYNFRSQKFGGPCPIRLKQMFWNQWWSIECHSIKLPAVSTNSKLAQKSSKCKSY